SVFIHLFGRSFLAVRLPSALMGSLVPGALYLLARAGYGRRVAILAATLAAGADAAVHFSRLGINNISDSLFTPWVLAAWWIGAATASPLAYMLGGLGLGLAQYYYFGSRTIPFVLTVMLISWLFADRQGVRRSWPLIVGSLMLAFVVAEPLIGYWLRIPGSITEHLPAESFIARVQERAAQAHV